MGGQGNEGHEGAYEGRSNEGHEGHEEGHEVRIASESDPSDIAGHFLFKLLQLRLCAARFETVYTAHMPSTTLFLFVSVGVSCKAKYLPCSISFVLQCSATGTRCFRAVNLPFSE